MADRTSESPLSPAPRYPERVTSVYERKTGTNTVRRGPLRFEEGLATDTDVPDDFQLGIMQGYRVAPGRMNHNANVYEKWPDETLKQRAHMGSAAWVEAPTFLGEFAHGSGPEAEMRYEQVDRGHPNPQGARYERINPAMVRD